MAQSIADMTRDQVIAELKNWCEASRIVVAAGLVGEDLAGFAEDHAAEYVHGSRSADNDAVFSFEDDSILHVHNAGHDVYPTGEDLQNSGEWNRETADEESALFAYADEQGWYGSEEDDEEDEDDADTDLESDNAVAFARAMEEGLSFFTSNTHTNPDYVSFVGQSWEDGGFTVDENGNPKGAASFKVEQLDATNEQHVNQVHEWYFGY